MAEVEAEIDLSISSWIAGRVSSLDTPQMLPRNLTVFAHTNPVYFLKDGKKVYVPSSANYLLKYLDSFENWLQKHSDFASSTDKSVAQKNLKRARTKLSQK